MATERRPAMSDTIRYDDCRLCGGRDLRDLPVPYRWAGKGSFEMVRGKIGLCRCGACGFIFTNPRPSDEILTAHYQSDDYSTHDDDNVADISPHHGAIDVLRRFVSMDESSKFLDYGCGAGRLLYAAQHAGWQAYGFDLGERAVSLCQSIGLNATTDLDEIKARRYDAIFLSHVFEHISEHTELLDELRELLEPGGAVLIDVPNVGGLRARLSHPLLSRKARFDERYRAYPAHLCYFTPKTLRRMLESRGWSVDGIVNAGMGLDELIVSNAPSSAAPPWTPPSRGRDGGAPSPVVRAKRAAKAIIRRAYFSLDLGENILAVARPQ